MTHYVESADRVTIAYSRAGEGLPALVFVHGGLADRTFWSNQMAAFAERYTVITLDLAGHGESGRSRTTWSIQAFGSDVRAVIDAEHLSHAVLIGNSMGGPAALEATLLVPERVIGIIGVDTFHAFGHRIDPSDARSRAELFRTDFTGAMKQMLGILFHPDADPVLVQEVEQRMAQNANRELWKMFESFADYDLAASIRRLKAPMRCLNGDLFPIDVEGNRRLHADFDAIVFPHTGHYPMLECPEDFNRALEKLVEDLYHSRSSSKSTSAPEATPNPIDCPP